MRQCVTQVELNLSFQCALDSFLCIKSDTDMLCESILCGLQWSEQSFCEEKILSGHFIPQPSILKQKVRPMGLLLPLSELFNRSYQTDLVTQAVALRRWRTSKNNISSIDIFNVWQRSNPRGHRTNGEILSVARTEVFF